MGRNGNDYAMAANSNTIAWAVALIPVEYVLVSARTIIIEGWHRGSILPGLWVLSGLTVVLLTAVTWIHNRATA